MSGLMSNLVNGKLSKNMVINDMLKEYIFFATFETTSNEEMAKNLIKTDLTPKQRQEEKQLLSERNERRDEETSQMHTWIIRSGKILRIKKKD